MDQKISTIITPFKDTDENNISWLLLTSILIQEICKSSTLHPEKYISFTCIFFFFFYFVPAELELRGGLQWRIWAEGGETARMILYWPKLEVECHATPAMPPTYCPPPRLIWSTPMCRWFFYPSSSSALTILHPNTSPHCTEASWSSAQPHRRSWPRAYNK